MKGVVFQIHLHGLERKQRMDSSSTQRRSWVLGSQMLEHLHFYLPPPMHVLSVSIPETIQYVQGHARATVSSKHIDVATCSTQFRIDSEQRAKTTFIPEVDHRNSGITNGIIEYSLL
ncbi:hypothetical protein CK203_072046 [Vitis vinifera]|uniref:Uncharacterized protein n=1 Tax=Vitis vinifera TaxID=29760 RepID=A0A438EXF4_VITVI|nr:hypothetical protein CK203_072046 [Vitis vinifera]